MVIYCDSGGNVKSVPSMVTFGESLTDITIVTPQQSAAVLLKIQPPTGEYLPDMICAPIINQDGIVIYNVKVFKGVTVSAGRCHYQLEFVGSGEHIAFDENGNEIISEGAVRWQSEKGSFNILRGTNIDLPLSEQILKDYALEELYSLLSSVTQVQHRFTNAENIIGIGKELDTAEKNIIDAINAINKKNGSSPDINLDGILGDFIVGSVTPGEYVGETITWDGVDPRHEPVISVTSSIGDHIMKGGLTKLSDSIPTFEQVNGNWSFTYKTVDITDGTTGTITIKYRADASSPMQTVYANGAVRLHIPLEDELFTPYVIIIPQNNMVVDDILFEESGVYTLWLELYNQRSHVTSLTVPGFDFKTLAKDTMVIKMSRLPEVVSESVEMVNKIIGGADIYVYNNGLVLSLVEFILVNYGIKAIAHIAVVGGLPDNIKESDVETGDIYLYVMASTGVVYGKLDGDISTLGTLFFGDESYDKGFVESPEYIGIGIGYTGVYTVLRESIAVDATLTESGKAADAYEVGKIASGFEKRLIALENIPFAEEVSV